VARAPPSDRTEGTGAPPKPGPARGGEPAEKTAAIALPALLTWLRSAAARRIPSDQRFQAALDAANGAREPDDKAKEIAAGLPVRFSETTHRASLIFDRKAAPGFDAFVRERLEALFAEYQLSQEG